MFIYVKCVLEVSCPELGCSVVELFYSKCELLGLIPSTGGKKNTTILSVL